MRWFLVLVWYLLAQCTYPGRYAEIIALVYAQSDMEFPIQADNAGCGRGSSRSQ